MSDLMEYGLELAFGADLSAPPETWPWANMADPANRPDGTTGRLRLAPAPELTSGQPNEHSATEPALFPCRLDNSDGALTPRRAKSKWHPNVTSGVPARLLFRGVANQLDLHAAGAVASTPDNAALHVAAPFVAVELAAPILMPSPSGPSYAVAGRWNATGNQRSFLMGWSFDGYPYIGWSEDGTAATSLFFTSLSPMPVPVAGGITLAALFDPDNGAGAAIATFWASHRLDDLLADPDGHLLSNNADTTTSTLHTGTAPFEAGSITGLAGDADTTPYTGLVRRVMLRDGGPAGTLAADLDVTDLADTATGVTDPASRVWSFTNAPLTRWRTVRTMRADQIRPAPHPVDGLQVVDITAAGVMRRLGRGTTGFQSALRRRVSSPEMAPFVAGHWPMEDGSGATQFASTTPGVLPGKFGGSIQLASDDGLPGSRPLPNVGGSTGFGWSVQVPAFSATDWRTDLFLRCPVTVTWTQLYVVKSTGTVKEWIIEVDATGTLRVRGLDADGVQLGTESVVGPDLDRFASVSLVLTQNGGNVDFALEYNELGSGSGTGSPTGSVAGTLGRPTIVGNLTTTPSGGMSFGQLVVSHGLPSFWLLSAPGNDAADGFTGESPWTRMARLCAEEQVPFRLVGEYPDHVKMGPQRYDLDLLGQLRECAETGGGLLLEDPYNLGLVGRTRMSMINQRPRIVIDLTQDGPLTPEPAEHHYGLRNVIQASRPGGSSATATTNPPPAAEDTYRDEATVNVPTDLHLPDQAGWRVHLGSVDEMRYPGVGILASTPGQVDELLEVGAGDVASIVGLPDDMPAPTTDQIVLGDRYTLNPATLKATLNTAPALPWNVIGVRDDGDTRRDTAGSETTASFVAGTGTSLTVATTLGPVWMDSGGYGSQFPFDIDVGGVHLTVTAIAGTTSPQTFTVVQAPLNGVAKTIPAGTPVRLLKPTIRAL